jgi:hypothetical protein
MRSGAAKPRERVYGECAMSNDRPPVDLPKLLAMVDFIRRRLIELGFTGK